MCRQDPSESEKLSCISWERNKQEGRPHVVLFDSHGIRQKIIVWTLVKKNERFRAESKTLGSNNDVETVMLAHQPFPNIIILPTLLLVP